MTYQIEKHVPMPAAGLTGRCKYPWNSMAIGDSFFVPLSHLSRRDYRPKPGPREIARGWKFRSLKTEENNVVGVRVWRVQ